MRKQKNTDNYFKNLKVKEEHKVISDKIKDLESKVKQKQLVNEEDKDDF